MQDHAITADQSTARSAVAAWTVVGICFAVLSVSFAARSLLWLSMPYLEKDLGWTRGVVSIGCAPSLVVMAAVSRIAGYIHNRFRARAPLCGGPLSVPLGLNLSTDIP